jgi:hypothetical protein
VSRPLSTLEDALGLALEALETIRHIARTQGHITIDQIERQLSVCQLIEFEADGALVKLAGWGERE